MASHMKSKLATSQAFARCCVLGGALVASAPSWAARDAGQMIAQDKANKAVIARRQAALDKAASAPETAASAGPARTVDMPAAANKK
jgi:hypothetical protein